MRKQVSYNDDLSLLGQRVRPIQPRTPASPAGDRYRLYSPTSGHGHHQQRPPGQIHFTPAVSASKKTTASKLQPGSKVTYALKINNVDDVTVPVAAGAGQLMRIAEASSVHELRALLDACTSTSSSAAASAASSSGSAARSTGVRVYERCFLQHCTALRDALGGPAGP